MGKEILTFENIEVEKNVFTAIRLLLFGRCRYLEIIII